jgi:dTDP-4-dehydrorhamnose reductase
MRIAITGNGGQLGGELCRQYGDEAVGLDLPDFDLTDRAGVARAIDAIRPDVVINTAAYTLVDRAEDEPETCRRINVDGVAHLAAACRDANALLVQISTDYVFGGDSPNRVPHGETDPVFPQGVYATTKLESERVAGAWEKHLIVRTCGLYGHLGPNSPGNFVDTMLRLAGQGRPLRIVDDQHCTPTYVPHLARALRFLVASNARGVFHVVNRGSATWLGFAAEIFRLAKLNVSVTPITTAMYGAKAPRPSYSVLDTAKYHALAGRPEMPAWQEALAEYLSLR